MNTFPVKTRVRIFQYKCNLLVHRRPFNILLCISIPLNPASDFGIMDYGRNFKVVIKRVCKGY